MWNAIIAITNFAALYPLNQSIINRDPLTSFLIFSAYLASFISHLAENHKGRLPGLMGVSTKTSWILNKIDVVAAWFLFLRLFYLYGFSGWNYPMLISAFVCSILSEWVPKISKNPLGHTITHSLWHILIFWSVGNRLTLN